MAFGSIIFLLYACDNYSDTKLKSYSSEYNLSRQKETVRFDADASISVTDSAKSYIKNTFSNGKLQSEGWTLNGKKTGYWKFYFPTGDLQCAGSFSDDSKTGWWEEYEVGKIKIFEGEMENNVRFGTAIHYHANGKIALRGSYSANSKTGWWEEYNEQGSKISEGYYKNGKRNGYFRFYLPDGITKDGTFVNNEFRGEWKKYKNGKIIQIDTYD
ncbi:MAG: hypothetical protein AUK44_00900 [Porphyromonadaceae bacterium CG2_30_38_12]|nr:MAG: hypothetical protein AUK44_00900 [Porphyromonadaceae bacterium CG2_30_38_12]